jgi:glycerate kinase
MRAVVAIDSFKGSLSSIEAGETVKKAILSLDGEAEVEVCPLADGGEGTVDALYAGLGGTLVQINVAGPLGKSVSAKYCILPDGVTAVIEMASAAGITLISRNELDPMKTTTFGVGEIIADAVERGCRNFVVGIGGSATNDGGVGMLSALGFEFLDADGNEISRGAIGLSRLESIKKDKVLPGLRECRFRIACDVDNPLCGDSGCSAVYGPQKGATAENIPLMDTWLNRYAEKTKEIFPLADPEASGSGAAGGMGFAFMSYLGATLESGIKIVTEESGLEEKIKNADIVVTGEGRLDGQSVMGKAPIGVAKTAKKYGKRVIAFSGVVTDDAVLCNQHGVDAFFPILRKITTLDEALEVKNAEKNLFDTATQVFRLIFLINKEK